MTSYKRTESAVSLDRIDRQIIELMCVDARSSLAEIGRELHLSRGSIHSRVSRLRQSGVIAGSTLILDFGMITNLVSAVILLRLQHRHLVETFERIKVLPRVTYCALLVGSANIIVMVRYAGSTQSYLDAIECFKDMPGVVSLDLLPVLTELKRSASVLQDLAEENVTPQKGSSPGCEFDACN